MTAPEIRGEKVEIYGYKAWIVKKARLMVDEKGLRVALKVHVLVEHPTDESGCYLYTIERGDEIRFDWFNDVNVIEMYKQIAAVLNELYERVKEKIAAFNVLKETLLKENIVVDAYCWGYWTKKESAIKELQ